MNQYAVMVYPAANRVYADSSIGLLRAELGVFNAAALGDRLTEVTKTSIGGAPYLTFAAPDNEPLSERDITLLSNLSSLYALFAVEGELLRPIPLHRMDTFDSDLLTIQKYSGKTNELFTKLLLNVASLATDAPADLVSRRLRVLDPMCGRGTTLNQALMYGFDASGVDIDKKDFDEYSRFIRTWLKDKRLKHRAAVTPIRREHRQLGRRLDVTLSASKQRHQAGDTQQLAFINADTTRCAEFFRAT